MGRWVAFKQQPFKHAETKIREQKLERIDPDKLIIIIIIIGHGYRAIERTVQTLARSNIGMV